MMLFTAKKAIFMLNESLFYCRQVDNYRQYILRSSDLEHSTNNTLGSSIWGEFHSDAVETYLQVLEINLDIKIFSYYF